MIGPKHICEHIEGMATHCVLFERVSHPLRSKDVNSYFGGQPRIPPGLKWPEWSDSCGSALALTFIAQIDLSEIPRTPKLNALPRSGTLFFFFNPKWSDASLDNESQGLGCVLYCSDDTRLLPEHVEPENLIACYGDQSYSEYEWLAHTRSDLHQYPRSFPKWPVKAHLVTGYRDQPPSFPHLDKGLQSDAHSIWWDMLFEMQVARLTEVFGPPVVKNRSCKELEKLCERVNGRFQLRLPEEFPFNWLCVEMISGNLIYDICRRRSRNSLPVKFDSVADDLMKGAQSWVRHARAKWRFSGLDSLERSEFTSWCEAIINASDSENNDPRHWVHFDKAIRAAYLKGPSLSRGFSTDAAARIPEWYMRDQKWQDSVFLDDGASNPEDILLDLVEHRMLGSFPKCPDGPTPKHLLLAKFDSDFGMNWCWGDCGSINFWIEEKDLLAARFENVMVRAG